MAPLSSGRTPSRQRVVRLLYGKRRNLPHKHSTAKPSILSVLDSLPHQPFHLTTAFPLTDKNSGRNPATAAPCRNSSSATPHSTLPSAIVSSTQQSASFDPLTSSSPRLESSTASSTAVPPHSFLEGVQRAVAVGELGRHELLHLLRRYRKLRRLDRSLALWQWCSAQDAAASPTKSAIGSGLWMASHDAVFMAHLNDVGSGVGGYKASNASAPGSRAETSHLTFAQQVYQRAVRAGRSTRPLLGGLLTAYTRAEDWKGALRVFQQHIVEDGQPTDCFHLHSVMNACRHAGAWEEGIRVFQVAVGTGPSTASPSMVASKAPLVVQPNAVVYLELLRLIAQSGWRQKHRHAIGILKALQNGQPGLHSPSKAEAKTAGMASSLKVQKDVSNGVVEGNASCAVVELTAGHYNAVLSTLKPAHHRYGNPLQCPASKTLVQQSLQLYEDMKHYGVQPSPETLPMLLATNPSDLNHLLFCVSECHRYGLPVTSEMYRMLLTVLLIQQRRPQSWDTSLLPSPHQPMRSGKPPRPLWDVRVPAWDTETRPGDGSPTMDALHFIRAEYQRYAMTGSQANSPGLLALGAAGSTSSNCNDTKRKKKSPLDEEVVPVHASELEMPDAKSISFAAASPDMIGLHITTALVDVLLAHPRPSEAQYWLLLFAPQIRPVLSPLTFGISDRLGVDPNEMQAVSNTSGVGQFKMATPSSFLLQVYGRVAVVDHNVLLSPSLDSLGSHYDTVLVPFAAVRVLVRRLKEFRPGTPQGRHTRRALYKLHQLVVAPAASSDEGGMVIRVLSLAHQLYAHRYLEHAIASPAGELFNALEERENPSTAAAAPPPRESPSTFREKLLEALRGEEPGEAVAAGKETSGASQSTSLACLDKIRAQEGLSLPVRHRVPRAATATEPPILTAKPSKPLFSSSVKKSFALYRPEAGITVPERVLAVACMVKTLNPDASVHVLTSHSTLKKPQSPSPLEKAVEAWNAAHLTASASSPPHTSTPESSPRKPDVKFKLTLVHHPEELAVKAPSELQLPPSRKHLEERTFRTRKKE